MLQYDSSAYESEKVCLVELVYSLRDGTETVDSESNIYLVIICVSRRSAAG